MKHSFSFFLTFRPNNFKTFTFFFRLYFLEHSFYRLIMKVCYLLPPSSNVFVCRYIYRLYLEQVAYPEAKQRITKPPPTEHWLPSHEQFLHRPTDHRPLTYRQVFNRPTDPPTGPPSTHRSPTTNTWTTNRSSTYPKTTNQRHLNHRPTDSPTK